jgi:hypothetical protein
MFIGESTLAAFVGAVGSRGDPEFIAIGGQCQRILQMRQGVRPTRPVPAATDNILIDVDHACRVIVIANKNAVQGGGIDGPGTSGVAQCEIRKFIALGQGVVDDGQGNTDGGAVCGVRRKGDGGGGEALVAASGGCASAEIDDIDGDVGQGVATAGGL